MAFISVSHLIGINWTAVEWGSPSKSTFKLKRRFPRWLFGKKRKKKKTLVQHKHPVCTSVGFVQDYSWKHPPVLLPNYISLKNN